MIEDTIINELSDRFPNDNISLDGVSHLDDTVIVSINWNNGPGMYDVHAAVRHIIEHNDNKVRFRLTHNIIPMSELCKYHFVERFNSEWDDNDL